MNLEEFMKLSWGEVSEKVAQAVAKEYQNDAYCYVVDMFEDAAICRFYYYMENGSKLMKIKYTCDDDGNVSLGDIVEVRVTYEEVDTKAEEVGVENATEIVEKEENEEDFVKSEETEDEKDEKDPEDVEETEDDEDDKEKVANASSGEDIEEENKDVTEYSDTTVLAEVSNAEGTQTEMKVSDGNEQVSTTTTTKETNTSSASFTNSERAEFEALKREKKINLLNSYKDILSEEDFNNFLGSIDSFEEDNLELELLKAYKNKKEEDAEPKTRAFVLAQILNNNTNNTNSIDNFIRRNL